uniref:Uncharacterized protein n=1 Tax=Candidatus Kentrum eta TaxID=2126337 RepID=A0A450V7Q7_9GAMM|nr:MAG: hypothetical protein BECKH772A_GA0070896_100585 [Candidatus Kentron sp. H]VFJ94177.1 MAG: hypothetical protein BECKH772B_GA0070898_100575 [Candidatus Kentron sp. H]VFK00862.1 MAG: hypothetical protein BECKH772C_GA0070978_100545 [Candidatus Kentron sp. H]
MGGAFGNARFFDCQGRFPTLPASYPACFVAKFIDSVSFRIDHGIKSIDFSSPLTVLVMGRFTFARFPMNFPICRTGFVTLLIDLMAIRMRFPQRKRRGAPRKSDDGRLICLFPARLYQYRIMHRRSEAKPR